jgi:hypothetical protein
MASISLECSEVHTADAVWNLRLSTVTQTFVANRYESLLCSHWHRDSGCALAGCWYCQATLTVREHYNLSHSDSASGTQAAGGTGSSYRSGRAVVHLPSGHDADDAHIIF